MASTLLPLAALGRLFPVVAGLRFPEVLCVGTASVGRKAATTTPNDPARIAIDEAIEQSATTLPQSLPRRNILFDTATPLMLLGAILIEDTGKRARS